MMPPPLTSDDPGGVLRIAEHHETKQRAGTCEHPVTLTGTRLIVDADTGRVLHRLDAADLTGRTLRLRCRNRRSSVCAACSTLYKLDAYHLISAGLSGGKNITDEIATHPRLFLTVTAPSFGRVHLGPDRAGRPRPCHRDCGHLHHADDPLIGAAVDPAGYDYVGQVLFNTHAGQLWAHLATAVRRHLAAAAGLTRKEAARQVRVVFAKVAEFQGRGVVHFHAIVRLDGPDGPGSPPPTWASTMLLRRSIRKAARQVTVITPPSRPVPSRVLRWGRQIDIQPIGGNDTGLSEATVARYVAKYSTKSTEAAGLDLKPICCRTCHGSGTRPATSGTTLCRDCAGSGRRHGVRLAALTGHVRNLVETCWQLGGHPAYAGLRLRRFAHQLGYRGHFCTKSRTYSTTFAALRAERRDWTDAQLAHRIGLDDRSLIVVNDWRYQGRAASEDADASLRHRPAGAG